MTLDDLLEEFRNHTTTRAGVTAIVRAVRDELSKCDWDEGENMIDALDEILGSDAGAEKVAGGSTREDEQSCNSSDGSSPTTDHIVDTNKMVPDAAPAVCVWNPNAKGWWVASCDKRYSFRKSALSKLSKCPECNAPIKFKEANHG